MLNEQQRNWIIVGLEAAQFMLNYLQSQTSVKPVAANMKWENVLVLDFAILCTWSQSLVNYVGICIQEDVDVLVQNLPDVALDHRKRIAEKDPEIVTDVDAIKFIDLNFSTILQQFL